MSLNVTTGDEVLMSMKVMKVDGSVDENNGLKYTVGDKSQGLLSTAIDKALGSMVKSEEAHLKSSPEYAEGAIIDLTLLQKAEKAISDKTATEKAESENVVAESVSVQQVVAEKVMVEKTAEEKVTIAKSTVANVAVEEVAAKTNYAYEHDDDTAGCTKGRWTVSNWKKSESTQDSWWCQLASGSQKRWKTQVSRLLRTRSFSASHLRSNLSAMKARS